MSDQILTRDSFINEIYCNENELNEGIFDFFNTLMKKEWKKIKSKNTTILDELEKVDRGLKGFTLVKMKKSGQCSEIRQLLCDFANTLWESKEKELEDGMKLQKMLMGLKDKDKVSDEDVDTVENHGKVSNYMKQFNVKDKALSDKLTNIEKRINKTCKGDPDLTRWTDILKDEIRNIVNDMIIDIYDKTASKEGKERAKEKRELLKKQQEQQRKDAEEKDKKALKKQNDELKEIEKSRLKTLSDIGVTAIKNQTGDKTYNTLNSTFDTYYDKIFASKKNENKLIYSFSNLINEAKGGDKELLNMISDEIGSDVHLGLNNIRKLKGINDTKASIILKELKIIYDIISKAPNIEKRLKDVPSDAVQALYVGLSELVQHAVTDGTLSDDVKKLLARCSIDSDKTLGYGIPLFDPKKPKEGNILVAISSTLMTAKNDEAFDGDTKEFNKFIQNIKKLFNEIQSTAEQLKEEKEKADEKEANEVEKEDENK